MEVLFKGIYTLYAGASAEAIALRSGLSGGLHFYNAPQDTNYPYGVYFMVSNVPERMFQERFENSIVQFSIFSSREHSTDAADEVVGNRDLLVALYDECALTITGYTHLYMLRFFDELLAVEDDVFQYSIRYRILAEKN